MVISAWLQQASWPAPQASDAVVGLRVGADVVGACVSVGGGDEDA